MKLKININNKKIDIENEKQFHHKDVNVESTRAFLKSNKKKEKEDKKEKEKENRNHDHQITIAKKNLIDKNKSNSDIYDMVNSDSNSTYRSPKREEINQEDDILSLNEENLRNPIIVKIKYYRNKAIPIIILLNTLNLIIRAQSMNTIVCDVFDIFFTILFLLDIAIIILTDGLIKDSESLLRRPIYIMDLIITLLSTINIIINIVNNIKENKNVIDMRHNYCNISQFRLIDFIIPLYQISYFSSMNIFINGTIKSLQNLVSVIILFGFFYTLFSIIGMHLWKNRFEYLCHDKTEPEDGFFPVIKLFKDTLCGGYNKCNGMENLCLSTKEFYLNGKLNYEKNGKKLYDMEIDNIDFNYGITKFNNILYSLLTVIISSTGQGWVKIMSQIMDGHSYWVGYIYFFIFQIIYNIILNNILLATIILSFEKKINDKVNVNTNIQAQLNDEAYDSKYKAKYQLIKKVHKNKKKIMKALEYSGKNKNWTFFIFHPKLSVYHRKFIVFYWIYLIYQQYLTQIIFFGFIIMNIIVVIIEIERKKTETEYFYKNGKHSYEYKVIYNIKLFIIIIYIFEQIVCFLSIGPSTFFHSFGYVSDLVVTVLCVIDYFTSFSLFTYNTINKPSILLGVLRITKLFFNVSVLPIFNHIIITISTFTRALIKSSSIIPLFVIYLIIYGLLGYSMFSNSLHYDNGYVYDKSFSSNVINFDNFFNSILATFIITIKDHWDEFFYYCYRSETNNKILTLFYYLNIVFIGQFLLQNLFIGFLLEQFLEQKENYELNSESRMYMIDKHLETTKLYQLEKVQEKGKESIFRINLFKVNKRLFADNGNLVLVGSSQINYDKYSSVISDNFYFLHSNKKNMYDKEILIGDTFKDYHIKTNKDKEKLEQVKYYHFNVNYINPKKPENLYLKKCNSETNIQVIPKGQKIIRQGLNLLYIEQLELEAEKNNEVGQSAKFNTENNKENENGNDLQKNDDCDESDSYNSFQNDSTPPQSSPSPSNSSESLPHAKNNNKQKSKIIAEEEKHNENEDCESEKRDVVNNMDDEKYISNVNLSSFKGSRKFKERENSSRTKVNVIFIDRDSKKKQSIISSKISNIMSKKSLISSNNDVELPKKRKKSFEIDFVPLKKRIMKKIIQMAKLRPKKKTIIKSLIKSINLSKYEELENKKRHCKLFEFVWNKSLFLFSKNSQIRIISHKLVNLQEFNGIMIFFIIVNTIVLCFDTEWIDPNSKEKKMFHLFNVILTIIFTLECILRIISDDLIFRTETKTSLGDKENKILESVIFYKNDDSTDFDRMEENEKVKSITNSLKKLKKRNTYLQDPYNIIDFICIIFSIFDIFFKNKNGNVFVLIAVLKSLKPIKIISKSKSIKILISVISDSLLSLLSSLFFTIVMILVFSIFGYYFFNTSTEKFCSLGLNYLNEEQCIRNNTNGEHGYWVNNLDGFSGIINSLKINFYILTSENWANIMSKTYIFSDYDKFSFLYFTISIIVLHLIIIKLIPSILIYYYREAEKNDVVYENLTDAEIQWVKFQSKMSKEKPTIMSVNINKMSKIFQKIHNILNSNKYVYFSRILSILNIFLACFKVNNTSSYISYLIDVLFCVIVLIFTAEIILKIIINGYELFKGFWNICDFASIVLNDIACILYVLKNRSEDFEKDDLSSESIIVGIFSLVRVFAIIPKFPIFIKNAIIFKEIIIKFSSFTFIIIILTTIYANIGSNIFGLLPYRKYINRVNNFEDFFGSFMIMLEVLTGSDWNMMMNEMVYHDCRDKNSDMYLNDYYCVNFNVICFDQGYINHSFVNYVKEHAEYFYGNNTNFDLRNNINAYHLSCGSGFSYVFFISYIIICQFIILSLCIVIILDSFKTSLKKEEDDKKGDFIPKFVSLWKEYDVDCKMIVEPYEFVLIFKELPPPYGVNYDRLIISNPLKYKQRDRQFKLFRSFLFTLEENVEVNDINFFDEYINQEYHHLPFAYQFSDFYLSKNMRFYTYDLEMLHFLNFLEMTATEDKTSVYSDEKSSYLFSNKLTNDVKKKKHYYIHFVDACMAISKYMIAKNEGVNLYSLRDNLVNAYTMNKWMENFNNNEILDLFISKEGRDGYKTQQMVYKLSPQIIVKAKHIFTKKKESLKFGKKAKKVKNTIDSKEEDKDKDKIDILKKEEKKENDNKSTMLKVSSRHVMRNSFMLLPNNSELKRIDRENYYKDVVKTNENQLMMVQKNRNDY